MLFFASLHNDNRNAQAVVNGQIVRQVNTVQTSLVAVDRRDGRIVFDKDLRGTLLDIVGDAAKNTVSVATNLQTVGLTFTDKPVQTTVRHSAGQETDRQTQ